MGAGRKIGSTEFIERKCSVCGKMFFPAPLHVYKRHGRNKHNIKWLCSYSCMLEWDRKHPRKYNTMN